MYSPIPAAFTAETLNTYGVPLVNPVTVAEVAVEMPSRNLIHWDAVLALYWTI